MKIFTKKRVIGVGVAAALLGGGAAYAYFTTTGSGTGSGSVGSSSTVTLHGTAATALYPGTSSVVNFTVDNPSPGHQYVNNITLTSVSVDTNHSGCVVADYTMASVPAHQDIPGNQTGVAIGVTGTLSMANTAVSQDACQGRADADAEPRQQLIRRARIGAGVGPAVMPHGGLSWELTRADKERPLAAPCTALGEHHDDQKGRHPGRRAHRDRRPVHHRVGVLHDHRIGQGTAAVSNMNAPTNVAGDIKPNVRTTHVSWTIPPTPSGSAPTSFTVAR